MQMVLGLALVFALILGSLWLLKRLSVHDRRPGRSAARRRGHRGRSAGARGPGGSR
ncbi:MAG: hypothetical protein MZW92_52485 [Comamonadaceae bacterium]|nr:hypothetical protein [Comamonadaceae bacterium]